MDLSNFTYENSNLYNENGDAVMMEWERDWMKESADIVCKSGGDILNIGHGLGLVDSYIQEHNPKSHTIIEIHPQVHEYMRENGWYEKAKVIESDWRVVIDKIKSFDGIYYDTWSNNWNDFENGLLNKLPYILNKNGIFSFWYHYDKESERLNKICNKHKLEISYKKISVDIPEVQYKNGRTYINPNLKSVLLPIIVNRNEPIMLKKNVI